MSYYTPESLARALRARGVPMSRQTLWRACVRGELAGAYRTAAGYWRLRAADVHARWPGLVAQVEADDAADDVREAA